jgi:hypothetical protein
MTVRTKRSRRERSQTCVWAVDGQKMYRKCDRDSASPKIALRPNGRRLKNIIPSVYYDELIYIIYSTTSISTATQNLPQAATPALRFQSQTVCCSTAAPVSRNGRMDSTAAAARHSSNKNGSCTWHRSSVVNKERLVQTLVNAFTATYVIAA